MKKNRTNVITLLAVIFSLGFVAVSLQSQADTQDTAKRNQSLAHSVVR